MLSAAVRGRPAEPYERLTLVFHPQREGWGCLSSLPGAAAVPWQVPAGQVLIVDQVSVSMTASQEETLRWSLPATDAQGHALIRLEHAFRVSRGPHGEAAPFNVVDTAHFGAGVILPAGSFLAPPCWSPARARVTSVRLMGRLRSTFTSLPPATATSRVGEAAGHPP